MEPNLERHYNDLLKVISEIGRDVKPAYTNSKVSTDRLRKSMPSIIEFNVHFTVIESVEPVSRDKGAYCTNDCAVIFFFNMQATNVSQFISY